jgi:hypothetical protein
MLTSPSHTIPFSPSQAMHALSLTATQPRAVCLRRAPAAKPTLLRAAAPRTAHRVRAVPTSAAPEAAAPAAAAERLYEAQLDKPIGVKFVRARAFVGYAGCAQF